MHYIQTHICNSSMKGLCSRLRIWYLRTIGMQLKVLLPHASVVFLNPSPQDECRVVLSTLVTLDGVWICNRIY
jgi:hypothetical protein